MALLTPFDLQLVIARLSDQCMGDSRYHLIDYAADNAAAIKARDFVMPAAFVMEASYQALRDEQGASGTFVNVAHDVEVGVLTAAQNYAATDGREQSKDAQDLRAWIWQAMIGWAPEDDGFVFDLGRGQLLSFDDQCFFYIDTFTLRRVSRQ